MRVLRGHAGTWTRQDRDSALAVGVFDGMHSGHRAVLAELHVQAHRLGVLPGVVTFDPHPLAVVAPERAPAMITDLEQRLELLEAIGMGLVAVVAFDEATRAWSPAEFALGLLAETLRARVVLAGEDFRFGRDRAGDVGALRDLGRSGGYETVVVGLVGADRPASSRALRALIAAGEVAAVAEELTRPHEVRGIAQGSGGALHVVVSPGMAVPGAGVYAGYLGRGAADWIPVVVRTAAGAVALRPLDSAVDCEGAAVRVRFAARLPDGQSTDAEDASARSLLGERGS